MILEIGNIISTRYRIIEKLEEGGFGRIFIAEDLLRFNSKCIVKQFIQPYSEDSEKGIKARELFQTEAKILSELEGYPQVPNLLAFIKNEDCIVQEFINGKSLINELGHFDEDKILNLLSQLLPILKEIHQKGILHRDIKPDNIIRNQQNDEFVLIDFGIAKKVLELQETTGQNTNFKTLKSTNIGTDGYQDPDSFSSPAGDLYSLGATCFHLLTGYHPSYANERSWINVDMAVKRETSIILKKLFEEDSSSRYQNAEEVLQDLRRTEDIQQREKLESILYLLNSNDNRYRNQAINDLAEFYSSDRLAVPKFITESVVPELINILQEEDLDLHISASNTLARIGEDSVSFLAKLLNHEKVEIRIRAASTLEEIGSRSQSAISQLIEALEDSDPYVRWYSVISIGKVGVPAKCAIPALLKRLKDSEPGIKSWALYAIGRMGYLAKEAESIIFELLQQETQTEIGIAGIEALDSIGVNIDQIQVASPDDNTIRTSAREWVLSVREKASQSLERKREQTRSGGLGMIEYRRLLSAFTPPLKDPVQFANLASSTLVNTL